MLRFEWDPAKAAENFKKHGVSFEEAETVFRDPLKSDLYDVDSSEREERWLSVGRSSEGRTLHVSYTERDVMDRIVIRIISARKATRLEREAYEEGE